ncbi:hypothetical protein ACFX1X_012070 [Malus domestica]
MNKLKKNKISFLQKVKVLENHWNFNHSRPLEFQDALGILNNQPTSSGGSIFRVEFLQQVTSKPLGFDGRFFETFERLVLAENVEVTAEVELGKQEKPVGRVDARVEHG